MKNDTIDSDEYSTDEAIKRKREQGETDESFGRSKKTMRTPTKSIQKSDDKLDLMLRLMKELQSDMKEIKQENKEIRDEILTMKTEKDYLLKENGEIKQENKEIKTELMEIKNRMEKIEKEKRENNVIMTGLTIDTNDTETLKQAMENFLKQHLDVVIDLKKAYKLGQKTCAMEMKNGEDKEKVMKNKYKLKQIRDGNIYINNDLTIREREKQKTIKKKAQEEREKGKEVKIGYNKLTVEGVVWRWNKVKEVGNISIKKLIQMHRTGSTITNKVTKKDMSMVGDGIYEERRKNYKTIE